MGDTVMSLYSVGQAIATLGTPVVKAALKTRNDKILRLRLITSPEYGRAEYGKLLEKKYFINRFCYLENEKRHMTKKVKNQEPRRLRANKIKSIIEDSKYNDRHIILSGSSGLGKSTLLRWLYVHVNSNEFDSLVYLPAHLFRACYCIDEVVSSIETILENAGRCIIFFDGADEVKCLTGKEKEFTTLLNGLMKLSVSGSTSRKLVGSGGHTIVMSTRPEHFNFTKTFLNESSEIDYNRLLVYRLLPMSRKEALKMCMSTIKRFKEIYNEKVTKDYENKIPKTRKEYRYYRKRLKQYLRSCDDRGKFSSTLDNPMLCRYSYQIVLNYYNDGDSHIYMTEREKREVALKAIIGWEYHDGELTVRKSVSKEDKSNEEAGKGEGTKHYNKVLAFLSEIAASADFEGKGIKRKAWDKLRDKHHIESLLELNSSLCLLEEDDTGNLSFMDLSLYEYFLAEWYASAEGCMVAEGAYERLCMLLKRNSEFTEMYSVSVSKRDVFSQIFYGLNVENLVSFAQGNRNLLFDGKVKATLDDILQYFPLSTIVYCGTNFDCHTLKRMVETETLELKYDPMYLESRSIHQLTRHTINSVVVPASAFRAMHDACLSYIAIYSEGNIYNFFGTISVSDRTLRSPSHLNSFYTQDKQHLQNLCYCVVKFLDPGKDYWCYYNYRKLSIHKATVDNADKLTKYFKDYFVEYPFYAINAYANYRMATDSAHDFLSNVQFINMWNDVKFFFNSNAKITLLSKNPDIGQYYLAWLNTRMRLKIEHNTSNLLATHRLAERNLKELLQLRNSLSNLDMEIINKLNCMISDELLLYYCIHEDSESVFDEAKSSQQWCEEANNIVGKKLREEILELRNSVDFNESIREMIIDKLANHVWLY